MSWSKSDKKSPMQTILQQECAIPTLLFFNAVQTDVRCLPLTTVLSYSYLKVHKTYIMNVQLYLFVSDIWVDLGMCACTDRQWWTNNTFKVIHKWLCYHLVSYCYLFFFLWKNWINPLYAKCQYKFLGVKPCLVLSSIFAKE